MKKLFALLLAVIMVLGLVACAPTPADPTTTGGNEDPTTTAPTTTEDPGVQFPLEEEVTLTFVSAVRAEVTNLEKSLAANKLWQDLYKATNVRIVVRTAADVDTLSAMINTGDYGDIIITQGYNETQLSDLIATGRLLAIEDYVSNPKIMPNFQRALEELPEIKGSFTSPDGHLYVMGSYSAEKSTYLESSLWINKTWLDMAEMTTEDISTLEGLETWFAWIMENDPNGNGKQDELPYYSYPQGSAMIEALLGMWGIPTKDAANENYIYIEDGEIKYVPMTEGWKDWAATMNKWYENGWLDKDYILGASKDYYENSRNTYIREIEGAAEVVAMWTGTGAPDRNKNTKGWLSDPCEYISILPPTVEGYETRWYMHPGYLGTKGAFAIASTCEHPEIALAWMDQFYSFDVNYRSEFGEFDNDKLVVVDAEGKIAKKDITNEDLLALIETDENRLDQIFASLPGATTKDDLENKLTTTAAVQAKRDALAKYESVINTEVWPRPYIDVDDAAELAELNTDIALLTTEYRAKVIKGDANLESDYDAYVNSLKQADIERFVEILQNAYDTWLAGQE